VGAAADGGVNVLDLCSGIGGFSLGFRRAGMRTVAFCECDEYCQRVLARHWPGVPIFPDIRELGADRLGGLGRIDVVSAGYPCQPFSVAGSRRAHEDDRHLWPEVSRIIAFTRPTWVVCENVVGHVSLGLDEVLFDLEGLGYAARPFVIPACAVGADHQRGRVWIVANADGVRELQPQGRKQVERRRDHLGAEQTTANADGEGSQERRLHAGVPGEARRDVDGQDASMDPWRTSEPALVRALHGIPNRVDRIRALGNAVVPAIPEIIGRAIMRAS